jgi:hypothetical protein
MDVNSLVAAGGRGMAGGGHVGLDGHGTREYTGNTQGGVSREYTGWEYTGTREYTGWGEREQREHILAIHCVTIPEGCQRSVFPMEAGSAAASRRSGGLRPSRAQACLRGAASAPAKSTAMQCRYAWRLQAQGQRGRPRAAAARMRACVAPDAQDPARRRVWRRRLHPLLQSQS